MLRQHQNTYCGSLASVSFARRYWCDTPVVVVVAGVMVIGGADGCGDGGGGGGGGDTQS